MQKGIHTLLDTFTSQIELTIRRMAPEQVEQALGGMGSSAARRGPGRPPKTAGNTQVRRATKGGKRSSVR
jgi:hypothetical protein